MSDLAAADPEGPRRLLEEILARREFQDGAAEPPGWVLELLDRILGRTGPAPPWMGDAITIGVVLAAILFLGHLFLEGRPSRRRDGAGAGGAGPGDAGRVSSVALFRKGCDELGGGRPSEAVVLFFRAMVARMTERGLLLDDASRTNREHLRDLRDRREEAAAVAVALGPFERVLYGRGRAAPAEAQRVLAAARVLFPEETP